MLDLSQISQNSVTSLEDNKLLFTVDQLQELLFMKELNDIHIKHKHVYSEVLVYMYLKNHKYSIYN